jgi:hypothetical protein
MVKLVFVGLTVFLPLIGFSAEMQESQPAPLTPSGLSMDQVVKERLYPGGRDEAPLQVQEEIPDPAVLVNFNDIHAQVLEEVTKEREKSQPSNDSEVSGE